jgi:uncharacterized phiE125 gp8 family phage protein
MIDDYYNITTPASEVPVTLAEAKAWAKIRVSADDTLITAMLPGIVDAGERYTNRVFVERTFEGFFSGLDASNRETYYFLQLRRAPLVSITSVEVYSDGAYSAFTDYKLKQNNGYSRLLFPNGIADADPNTDYPYPVKVTFVAGYGAAADVPETLKHGIMAHIAFLYENRGDVIAEGGLRMPLEAKMLYHKYKIINTF